jgi:hypothetical protein
LPGNGHDEQYPRQASEYGMSVALPQHRHKMGLHDTDSSDNDRDDEKSLPCPHELSERVLKSVRRLSEAVG